MINVTDVGTVAPVRRKTQVDINPISAGGGGVGTSGKARMKFYQG